MSRRIHSQALVDRLGEFRPKKFDGEAFRTTRIGADSLAPSIIGGRWAPPPNEDHSVAILYTSLQREGSLAEVVSFLGDLTPIPAERPIKVSRLGVSTSQTLRLAASAWKLLASI